MKKITLLFVTGICGLSAFAQTDKGQFLVGASLGSASFSNSESTTTYSNTPTEYKSKGSYTSAGVYPNVGWFVRDNLAIGTYLGYNIYKSNSTSSNTSSPTTTESDYKSPSLYIGPFAQFYFGGGEKGKAFARGSFQWGTNPTTNTSKTSSGSSSETKSKSEANTAISGGVGYEQFLSRMVGVYFLISYNNTHSRYTNDYKPSTGTGYSYTNDYKSNYLSFAVGFQVHLDAPKSKK